MPGNLAKTLSGLIVAETFESYPNGWTFSQSGQVSGHGCLATAGVGSPRTGHAGNNMWLEILGAIGDTPDEGWVKDQWAQLVKTLNLGSGAGRVAKVFRGCGFSEPVYDDFLGSAYNGGLWTLDNGSAPTVASSIATFAVGSTAHTRLVSTTSYTRASSNNQGSMTWAFRIRNTGGATARLFAVWKGNDSDGIFLQFTSMAVQLCTKSGGSLVLGAGIAVDLTVFHTITVTWTAVPGGGFNVEMFIDGASADIHATDIGTGSDPMALGAHYSSTDYAGYDVDWLGESVQPGCAKVSFIVGTMTWFNENAGLDGRDPHSLKDNSYYPIPVASMATWQAITDTGNQTATFKVLNANVRGVGWPYDAFRRNMYFDIDDFLVMAGLLLTVNALSGGQKVELYDSGGSLRQTATCPVTNTPITFDLSGLIPSAFGFYGYMKVYDTDGITLLYTTPTMYSFGGDGWTWVGAASQIVLAADNPKIYRTGAGLSPGTATVTATMTNVATGLPVSGETLAWSCFLGSVSPASSVTDANGHASTVFTPSAAAGLGGVRCDFAGDSNYSPGFGIQLIDVYYALPAGDATKDFQVFVQGQEMPYNSGNYKLSSDFKPQTFTVTGPLGPLTGFWWAVEIYRLGVKEFQGRILTRRRVSGASAQLTITGVDETIMLQRRVANRNYLDDPKYIIQDLLTRYPTGIVAGTISLFANTISLPITYDNVYDALVQIANATGWIIRRNITNTLDFAPSFGSLKSISITVGGSSGVTADHTEDATQLDTKVVVIGNPSTLVSIFEDTASELIYGYIEEVFIVKTITAQGTLDLNAQTTLANRKVPRDTIILDWIDSLATGSYAPGDSLTVTDADAGLSGTYTVYGITRDLADAYLAKLELTTRLVTIADALQSIRSVVKDLGVL